MANEPLAVRSAVIRAVPHLGRHLDEPDDPGGVRSEYEAGGLPRDARLHRLPRAVQGLHGDSRLWESMGE